MEIYYIGCILSFIIFLVSIRNTEQSVDMVLTAIIIITFSSGIGFFIIAIGMYDEYIYKKEKICLTCKYMKTTQSLKEKHCANIESSYFCKDIYYCKSDCKKYSR